MTRWGSLSGKRQSGALSSGPTVSGSLSVGVWAPKASAGQGTCPCEQLLRPPPGPGWPQLPGRTAHSSSAARTSSPPCPWSSLPAPQHSARLALRLCVPAPPSPTSGLQLFCPAPPPRPARASAPVQSCSPLLPSPRAFLPEVHGSGRAAQSEGAGAGLSRRPHRTPGQGQSRVCERWGQGQGCRPSWSLCVRGPGPWHGDDLLEPEELPRSHWHPTNRPTGHLLTPATGPWESQRVRSEA